MIQIPKSRSNEYDESVLNKYNQFIQYSELPESCKYVELENDILPRKFQKVVDNIKPAIDTKTSIIVRVQDYIVSSKFSSILLDTYFQKCYLNNDILRTVLYVDTNLLVQDYKKLMDSDKVNSLSHSYDLLSEKIFTADYVIWNRFSMVASNYDIAKVYNILLERYRKNLGNLFFTITSDTELIDIFSEEVWHLMASTHTQDCTLENIEFKKKGSNLQW